jgi:hypothetical protein
VGQRPHTDSHYSQVVRVALLQQLLDPLHGFLPAHVLLDGQTLECLDRYQTVRPLGRTFGYQTITD